MQPKQVTFTVDTSEGKKEFVQWKWSPQKCFKNLPVIGKSFAVPLTMMISGSEEGIQENLPTALFMLFDQMEENDIWSLFKLIVEDVKYENRDIDLDADLGYDLDSVLCVVAEALGNNYGSLLSGKGFGNLINKMVPMAQLTQDK